MNIYVINSKATDWMLKSIFLESIRRCEPDANIIVTTLSIGGRGDFLSMEYTQAIEFRLENIPDWIRGNMDSLILVSDVDIYYLKPFISVMKAEASGYDILFQREHMNPCRGVNCGQILIQCSQKAVAFFESLRDECRRTKSLDRDIINNKLAESGLRHKVLSPLFANTNIGLFKDMYSYHAICTIPTPQKSSMQLKREQFDALTVYISSYCQPAISLPSIAASFCINLDRRPERWEAFSIRAREAGFGFIKRFRAIDGDTLEIPIVLQTHRGTYGCLYSHAAIYKDALGKKYESVFIAEDDCVFTPDSSQIATYVTATQGEYSWIHFGGSEKCYPELVEHKGTHVHLKSIMNTHAYIVDKRLMQFYVEYLDKNPLPRNGLLHSDRLLAYLCQRHSLKICIPPKPMAVQDRSLPRDVQWGIPGNT